MPLKKSIRFYKSGRNSDITNLCATSHLVSTLSSLVQTHGRIFPYRVATLVSMTRNRALVALWLSTKLNKNLWDIIVITVAPAVMDGWRGIGDVPTGSELEVGADVEVAGVLSPWVLNSRVSLLFSISRLMLTPTSSSYISIGYIGPNGSSNWPKVL